MSVRENNRTTEKERSNNKTERLPVSLLDTPSNSPQYGRGIHKKYTVNNQLKKRTPHAEVDEGKRKWTAEIHTGPLHRAIDYIVFNAVSAILWRQLLINGDH